MTLKPCSELFHSPAKSCMALQACLFIAQYALQNVRQHVERPTNVAASRRRCEGEKSEGDSMCGSGSRKEDFQFAEFTASGGAQSDHTRPEIPDSTPAAILSLLETEK